LSDPIDLAVQELDSLSVSLYFPEDTGPCTCHAAGMYNAQLSGPGDFTAASFQPAETLQMRAFLSGVEVWAARTKVVVALGDSITDGAGSTPNANHRWPDLLAERLSGRKSKSRWGVVNVGIGGNRVIGDGAGDNALARFDRDVLSVPGVTHVIVFEGVNDLGVAFGPASDALAPFRGMFPPSGPVTRDTMIAAYRQLIARAHAKGLKIYGATIGPYEGFLYHSPEGEAVRQGINQWIRSSGEFDAVLDFDAILRDPKQPTRMADGMHAGDHLHGSDAGYRAIVDSIDLSLFE
jgi:lysophospholipase L1-like esterase